MLRAHPVGGPRERAGAAQPVCGVRGAGGAARRRDVPGEGPRHRPRRGLHPQAPQHRAQQTGQAPPRGGERGAQNQPPRGGAQ